MAGAAADRNLLVGIIALQMDFISRDALIAAMSAWVLHKATPLSQVLLDQGGLSPSRRSLLDALVEEHIKLHDNDTQKSLAALSSIASVRDQLSRIADPDIQASLPRVSAARTHAELDDPMRTHAATPGESTAPGLRFRVLRPHAKGGLGQVAVALDTELDRPVALKEIQDQHADDRTSRARFVQEAEITGKLEHPGIIPVYGLGHYADGRPFYAMRFIQGDSLKEAIERFHRDETLTRDPGRRALRLRELLRRFTDVCNAIAYAHSRGILHRDLKPGNVMLGPFGETLVVDWGMAKPAGTPAIRGTLPASPAADSPIRLSALSGSRDETMPGAAVGTPAFMSPEQAHGQLERLGPRSDIYSLGATLYCILTGRVPFDGADLGAVLRAVQKGEFQRPRTVDASVDASLESVCLKAMALKPEDRYDSARELAHDVERWLADEPVAARSEPISVRARRWMRRHRTLVTSTAAALAIGLAGLAGFATVISGKNLQLQSKNGELDAKNLQLGAKNHELDAINLQLVGKNRELDASNQELERQRQLAEHERDRAVKAEKAAREGEERTKQSELQARAVLDFFQAKVLSAARPKDWDGGLGVNVTIRAAIDAAEAGIESSFRGNPSVEASIRSSLGTNYLEWGDPNRAIHQFERALSLRRQILGSDDPDTLRSMNGLAVALRNARRFADALPLSEETLKLRKAKLGRYNPDTLQAMNNLALVYSDLGRSDDSLALYQETLKIRKALYPHNDPDTLLLMDNFAVGLRRAGHLKEAVRLAEETVKLTQAKLGISHPRTLWAMRNLADAYWQSGRLDEALHVFEKTLVLSKAELGVDHPDTLATMNSLAEAYREARRFSEASALSEETLKLCKIKLGPEHSGTLISMNNVARGYWDSGRRNDAVALFEQTLKLEKVNLGLEHAQTLKTMSNLADAYYRLGRFQDAVSLYEEVVRTGKARFGTDKPGTLTAMNGLAVAYRDAGRHSDALPLFVEVLRLRKAKFGLDDPSTLISMSNLALGYLYAGRGNQAMPLLVETLQLRKAKLGPTHVETLISMNNLALGYSEDGRLNDAVLLYEQTRKLMKSTLGSEHADTLNTLNNLAAAYLTLKRWTEAGETARECLAVQEKKAPQNWPRYFAMSQLGAALAGQEKYAEAEPLLIQGYQGLKAREAKLPARYWRRINVGATRIIDLYEAWGKKAKAEEWKLKLGFHDLPANVFARP
jgi:serine/threonine protein kinase/tetratricopeptide (TPR) repeat protein